MGRQIYDGGWMEVFPVDRKGTCSAWWVNWAVNNRLGIGCQHNFRVVYMGVMMDDPFSCFLFQHLDIADYTK